MKNLLKHRKESTGAEEEGLPKGMKNISEKDLDDPKVQNQLLEAAMAQYYDSERGYFNLGGKGWIDLLSTVLGVLWSVFPKILHWRCPSTIPCV